MRALTDEKYKEKVRAIHGNNLEILSPYLGSTKPITYRCTAKKHITTINHAFWLTRPECVGCKACSYALKPFKWKKRDSTEKFPIKGRDYILPPPFNCYCLTYLGNGKWEAFSSRGKLVPALNKDGYTDYQIKPKKGGKGLTLHRLVYALKVQNWHFLKLTKKGITVDHRDQNVDNNRPKNLRLANHKQQNYNRSCVVLKDSEILNKIQKLYAKGWSQRGIAEKLNCCQASISNALHGKHPKEFKP